MEEPKKYNTEQRIYFAVRDNKERLAGMTLEEDVGPEYRRFVKAIVNVMDEQLEAMKDLRQSKLLQEAAKA